MPVMSQGCSNSRKIRWSVLVLCCLAALPGRAVCGDLDDDIDTLAADVADLSQSLSGLEQTLLYPVNTQVAVYLSVADHDGFVLDSVELSINGQPAVSHLYTDQERLALSQGAIQQLYMGNLPRGKHHLTATLNGQSANDHYVRQERDFTLDKQSGETRVQLVLNTGRQGQQPGFELREWQ